MSKYSGIDERDIKCCCKNIKCRETGVSFEGNILRFHFLEYIDFLDKKILTQTTRTMFLNKRTAQDLIKELKKII